jgi:hypothetical protein
VELFTLNFDDLLEQALADALDEVGADRGVFSRSAATPRAHRGDHEVHHLHGFLPASPEDEPRDIVLTLSDFNRMGEEARPWQVAALQDSVSRGPLILAGTSYRDGDVRQWLHDVAPKRSGETASVLVILAREALALSRSQFAAVESAVRQQWASLGVQVLLVHEHADAAQVIWELPMIGQDDYQAPAVRTSLLWDRQLDNFTVLQARHAEMLQADLSNHEAVLGRGSHLTLWFSDGSQHLRRWSSHDRVYRYPDLLRKVPIGYDSPWIVGQALGQNRVLARELPRGLSDTRRWRAVAAAPVIAELPGGPPLAVAVVSAATSDDLDQEALDNWTTAITDIAQEWGDRLGSDD